MDDDLSGSNEKIKNREHIKSIKDDGLMCFFWRN